jgi:phage-related protein
MPNPTNQLRWLNTRYAAILQDLTDNASGETNEKILELLMLNQQIQAQMMITILANQEQQRQDTDNQLMEIGKYLQEIVSSHIREAENLKKIR